MLDLGIIALARLGSSRLPNKIMLEIGDIKIIDIITKKLKKLKMPIIAAIPDSPENDNLAEEFLKRKIELYRGSEMDVLSRFEGASTILNTEFVQRFNCDNVLFDPEYFRACYHQVSEFSNKYDLFSNIKCQNHPGQSVEIIRKDCTRVTNSSRFEKEHVFPYYYNNIDSVFKLKCPTSKVFPIDTQRDLEMLKELKFGYDRD